MSKVPLCPMIVLQVLAVSGLTVAVEVLMTHSSNIVENMLSHLIQDLAQPDIADEASAFALQASTTLAFA